MGLPYSLYRFNTFINGDSFLGETEEVELPKLSRKFEEFQSGGMGGPVKLDFGNEAMEASIKFGGLVRRALSHYAAPTVDGVQLRWVGAYKSGTSAIPQSLEVTMRGRFQEIEFGTQKAGEKSEQKMKFPISYYKVVIDGQTVIEIDQLAGITIVDGVDTDAAFRAIIGL
ncbi:phage major tail tube protein [Lysobacter brunescens]|uniref:Phage major tail tube protein n=1 Tax=Lysobacter brunescens TaxID=262323 RepID=A0ABW2YF14_9GAMM